jgi:hypothetical protein
MTAMSLPEYLPLALVTGLRIREKKVKDSPVCEFGKMLEILRRKSVGCGSDI